MTDQARKCIDCANYEDATLKCQRVAKNLMVPAQGPVNRLASVERIARMDPATGVTCGEGALYFAPIPAPPPASSGPGPAA